MTEATIRAMIELLYNSEWIDTNVTYDDSAMLCPHCGGAQPGVYDDRFLENCNLHDGHTGNCPLMAVRENLRKEGYDHLWLDIEEADKLRQATIAAEQLKQHQQHMSEIAADYRWHESLPKRKPEED